MGNGYTYKVAEKDINKLKIEVKVDSDKLHANEEKIFAEKASRIKVPGFRPGKAPKEMVQGRIALDVMTEAVNRIVPEIAVEVISEEKLNPIAKLEYDFPQSKDGDDSFLFNFTVYVSPEVKVDDLKKIKLEWKEPEVTPEEIDDVIRSLIRSTVPQSEWMPKTEEKPKKPAKKTDDVETRDENKKEESVNPQDVKFVITDELVAKIGYEEKETYESIKNKVKDSLSNIKKGSAEGEFFEKIIENAKSIIKFHVPHEMIHEEIHRREHSFEDRLKKINLDKDAYLKTLGKTWEQQTEEWHNEIEKSIFADLLAIQVAVNEKLTPTEDDLEKEIDRMEDEMTKIRYRSDDNMRQYLNTIMTRRNGMNKMIEIVKAEKK